MQIIILGPPGVGKGTQSDLLAQKLGVIHLSTGDILRRSVEEKTLLGLRAKEIMEKGQLVPDDIMIGIIEECLSRPEMKTRGFVLDGFPRTLEQAIALSSIFARLGFNQPIIINLNANENELIKRLVSRGRKDDTMETVKKRLEVYKELTEPVKDYYKTSATVYKINGIGSINRINANILSVIKKSVVPADSDNKNFS